MNRIDRKDHFWRKAKTEGYRSRAAYKLLQLHHQHRIFRKGDRVIDLGCAPGGWIQVIIAEVGAQGLVVGVDKKRIDPLRYKNLRVVEGDLHDEQTRKQVMTYLDGLADVITSDMSPDLSGIRFRDHHLACELVRVGLEFCKDNLKMGGTYLAKVFEGEELQVLNSLMLNSFAAVKRIVPNASRKGSAEIYFLARGYNQR